jgi:hypothetical protein
VIRDFEYSPTTYQLAYILLCFGFDLTADKIPFDLLRFEVITPDSFIWKLIIGDNVYYLYAEDYVPGLNYVRGVLDSYVESNKWEFVSPTKTIPFELASPVRQANVYQKPDDADEIMKYALASGYDFVFLVKSYEDINDAKFSKDIPNKF